MTLNNRMAEILALTRTGKLQDATALIQQTLGAKIADGPGAAMTIPAPIDIRARPPLALPMPGRVFRPAARSASHKDSEKGLRRCRHTASSGSIEYLLYVPTKVETALPLVVMLHGCTQSADDFARGTRMNELAEELGFIVAYPEQTKSANAQKCWNWFRPGDQAKGRGEPELIAGVTRYAIANNQVDATRVYVAGLSAGGAAAAIMADAYPELFAAVGIHSGLACGAAKDLPSAFAAMQGRGAKQHRRARTYVPVITFHGDLDGTVHPSNSEQIHSTWAADPTLSSLERQVERGGSAGGRRYSRTAWIDGNGRSVAERWEIAGAGHAWSGGSSSGSYTDSSGPDASREMLRFFLQHRKQA